MTTTNVSRLIEALSKEQIRALREIEMPWIPNESARRDVAEIIQQVKETASQIDDMLSQISGVIKSEVEVLRVKTSVSNQTRMRIPEDVLRDEILHNQASHLAQSIMKYCTSTAEEDPTGDTTIYTTIVGIQYPK